MYYLLYDSFQINLQTYLSFVSAVVNVNGLFPIIHCSWDPLDHWFNSLWPNDPIWCQWSWSTLVRVKACCLMATSLYLMQCDGNMLIGFCFHWVSTLLMLETEYSYFGGQYHVCLFPGAWTHQNISRHGIGCIGQTTYIIVPDLISSTWVKPNPRYNPKCIYIFSYLQNNSAC